jgi:hypothetical protein
VASRMGAARAGAAGGAPAHGAAAAAVAAAAASAAAAPAGPDAAGEARAALGAEAGAGVPGGDGEAAEPRASPGTPRVDAPAAASVPAGARGNNACARLRADLPCSCCFGVCVCVQSHGGLHAPCGLPDAARQASEEIAARRAERRRGAAAARGARRGAAKPCGWGPPANRRGRERPAGARGLRPAAQRRLQRGGGRARAAQDQRPAHAGLPAEHRGAARAPWAPLHCAAWPLRTSEFLQSIEARRELWRQTCAALLVAPARDVAQGVLPGQTGLRSGLWRFGRAGKAAEQARRSSRHGVPHGRQGWMAPCPSVSPALAHGRPALYIRARLVRSTQSHLRCGVARVCTRKDAGGIGWP